MKIEITPSLQVAEILKSKACSCGSSRDSLRAAGMASLAEKEETLASRPATDWMVSRVVELGARNRTRMIPGDAKTQQAELEREAIFAENTAAAALWELGLNLRAALKYAAEVKITIY